MYPMRSLIFLAIASQAFGSRNNGEVTVVKNTTVLPFDAFATACETSLLDFTQESIIGKLKNAGQSNFIVFDDGFFPVLGTAPRLDPVASLSGIPMDNQYTLAPIKGMDKLLIIAQDGTVSILNLVANAPKIDNVTLHLPITSIKSAAHQSGLLYLAANGPDVPVIATLDVDELSVMPILNNFQGHRFANLQSAIATLDENLIFLDGSGPGTSELDWPGDTCVNLPPALYFYNTTSRITHTLANHFPGSIVGITLSPDERIVYFVGHMAHSGLVGTTSIYAFDLDGHFTSGPMLVYQSGELLTGDIAVSSTGILFAASTTGVAIVDPSTGRLLGNVHIHADSIRAVAYVAETEKLYIGGKEHIYQIKLIETNH